MTLFIRDKLLIATHNAGKLREFQDLLGPYVKEIVSAGQLGLPEPEETGTTFEENALIKARAAAQASELVTLADDSGLCVEALGGKPGLHSARWAGPEKDFAKAVRRIRQESGTHDSAAYFLCILALVWPEGRKEIIEGRCDGVLIWEPRGTRGHGYDAWFVPRGHTQTFAEMEDAQKNALSHRGQALRHLVAKHFEEKYDGE